MPFTVTWIDELRSTNAYLKASLEKPSPQANQVIVARKQVAGRGRAQRRWISEPYKDLTCSLLLLSAAPLHALPSLTMVIALGVRDMLASYGLDAEVKWPNDVLVQGRKICGILAEAIAGAGGSGRHWLLVGIGLNIGMSEALRATIDQPATSLQSETGQEHTIESVLAALLAILPQWLNRWEEGGFAAIRPEWMRYERRLHSRVQVGHGHTAQYGVLEDFGDHGELLLRDDEGRLHVCIYGDLQGDPNTRPTANP